ncbi:MAG: hypothetical protein A2Z14_00555 [Chloroflexi bacterium RBG_16_48_8]|nr:MAG: hypothetical protein A2Z14_00555 [Chloroflexi bacterium RBG_16_48_8]
MKEALLPEVGGHFLGEVVSLGIAMARIRLELGRKKNLHKNIKISQATIKRILISKGPRTPPL